MKGVNLEHRRIQNFPAASSGTSGKNPQEPLVSFASCLFIYTSLLGFFDRPLL